MPYIFELVINVGISRNGLTSWIACTHWCPWFRILSGRKKGSKLEIPGQSSFYRFKIRNQKFYNIQVIVFDLGYLPLASVTQVRYHEKIVKNIKKSEIILYILTRSIYIFCLNSIINFENTSLIQINNEKKKMVPDFLIFFTFFSL